MLDLANVGFGASHVLSKNPHPPNFAHASVGHQTLEHLRHFQADPGRQCLHFPERGKAFTDSRICDRRITGQHVRRGGHIAGTLYVVLAT